MLAHRSWAMPGNAGLSWAMPGVTIVCLRGNMFRFTGRLVSWRRLIRLVVKDSLLLVIRLKGDVGYLRIGNYNQCVYFLTCSVPLCLRLCDLKYCCRFFAAFLLIALHPPFYI